MLTFLLHAPFAANGGVAVGKARPGWGRPSRSGTLGMIAACLGIDRGEEDRLLALERQYGLAFLVENSGAVWEDFHTVRATTSPGSFPTRADELARVLPNGKLNDIHIDISRREYRSDMVCFAAFWPRADGNWPLDDIAERMRRPIFLPYWGRRSCVFGLPLAPVLHGTANPLGALVARQADGPERAFLPQVEAGDAQYIAADAADAVRYGGFRRSVVERRDTLVSRRGWMFGLRQEVMIPRSEWRFAEVAPCT